MDKFNSSTSCLNFSVQVIDGVVYLHQAGIAHCNILSTFNFKGDLNSSNILISDCLNLKIKPGNKFQNDDKEGLNNDLRLSFDTSLIIF